MYLCTMVIKVEFTKELEQEFRELAMRRFGFSKGAIKKASEEAIKRWVKEENRDLPKLEHPIKKIKGVMKNLRGKYTSVELQHEAVKIWKKKV
jgi:hypothetical protein